MKPIFKVNLYFLIVLIISMIAPQFTTPILYRSGLSVPLVLTANHIILFIIPAIIYIICTKANIKEVLSLRRPKIKDVFRAILIAILAQPVMVFFSYLSSLFFYNDVSLFMESTRSYSIWLMLLVVAVTPAISEEITIRGVVLSGYKYKNKYIASIMTGFIFGVFHLNAQQFLYAFVIGIILAYMVRATGSIVVSMITHFTINASQLLLQRIASNGVSVDELKGQMEVIQNMSLANKLIPLAIYFILAIIFGMLIYRVLRKMENDNLDISSRGKNINCAPEYLLENPINIPFVLSIIAFMVYMLFIAFV